MAESSLTGFILQQAFKSRDEAKAKKASQDKAAASGKKVDDKDRKGLLMAGADQAIRELLMIFKDDPIEGPLQEASMSVWAKMQLSE